MLKKWKPGWAYGVLLFYLDLVLYIRKGKRIIYVYAFGCHAVEEETGKLEDSQKWDFWKDYI